jgi:hypothetical protein
MDSLLSGGGVFPSVLRPPYVLITETAIVLLETSIPRTLSPRVSRDAAHPVWRAAVLQVIISSSLS